MKNKRKYIENHKVIPAQTDIKKNQQHKQRKQIDTIDKILRYH